VTPERLAEIEAASQTNFMKHAPWDWVRELCAALREAQNKSGSAHYIELGEELAATRKRLALAEAIAEAVINMRITGHGHSDTFEDDSDGTLVKALEAWRAGRGK
jgi:hypothetical protein